MSRPFQRKARYFAGVDSSLDEHNFVVLGLGCELFRDDEAAQRLHDGSHLVPWKGDGSPLVDRYDARLLLDTLPRARVTRVGP